MSLNTFYFGETDRQLYGMYDPPAGGGEHGAVLCAPWGQEYLRAHQSLRQLARMLAREGIHAFRFDYFGTGDSDGGDLDGSIHDWVTDTSAAIDELKDTAGLRTVSVIGLRLGAVVSARACAMRRDVKRLVLWDPVFDGEAYLQTLLPALAQDAPTFPLQVAGLPVSEHAFNDVRAVSEDAFGASLPRTLVVSTESESACEPLTRKLQSNGVSVSSAYHHGPRAWLEAGNTGSAGMPVVALRAIVDWLAA
jgi:alpha-beta hydrolase superfamily lysophospholipase